MAETSRCEWRWLQPHCVLFVLLLCTIDGISCQDALIRTEGGTQVNNYLEATKHSLPSPLVFFGKKYSDIYVSPDGLIGFESGVGFQHTHDFWDTGKPSIAPFYYWAERPDGAPPHVEVVGSIWINQTTNATLLRELSSFVNSNALGIRHFSALYAVVVTWENVTDLNSVTNGDCHPAQPSLATCKTSTFQAVIVANADTTAVIFHYGKMDVNCGSHCGAGVNGGKNRDYLHLLPCQNHDCFTQHLQHLPHIYGTDVAGRFLFLVSRPVPTRGGCVDTDVITQPRLDFYPKAVGMFGGEIIDVTPPCPKSASSRQVTCTFGDQSATSFQAVIDRPRNSMSTKVRCVMPRMTVRGELSWTVGVSGRIFQTSQPLTIILPSRQGNTLQPGSMGWTETNPQQLRMNWRPELLSQTPSTHVQVVLVLYREDDATGQTIWKEIVMSEDTLTDQGYFLFNTQDKKCQGEDCKLFEVGVGEVRLKSQYLNSAESHGVLNYGTIPLGWWMHEAMVAEYGEKWPARRCEIWNEQDGKDRQWEEELLHCPCNIVQAITDFGRWQPDMGCNMYTGSVCVYHKGAKHCVRSVQPSSPGGHGNQCCYREDGSLLYAADSFQGSTPDRGHDWGAAPYGRPGRVPSLSHWIHDVVTFYYCCLWDEYNNCDKYMDLRATRDCKGYQVPKSATAYGDPHITTFDGSTYYMGGKGDFWLLQSSFGLKIQAKMAAWGLTNTSGTGDSKINGTAMTAVAMQSGNSPTVVVQLQDAGLLDSGLDVLVGAQRRHFLRQADFWQDFQDVSVMSNTAANASVPLSNVTVIFSNGAGVMVAAVKGLLHVTVVVPPQAKRKTTGLLGTWDDDSGNDFLTRTGVQIQSSADALTKYRNFSLTWSVNKGENLFPEGSQSPAVLDFVPKFPIDLSSNTQEFCHGSTPCNFDFAITQNRDLALSSKTAEENFRQIQSFQTQELNCGWLPVPQAQKSSYNNKLGSMITITGCRNGEQVRGETTYTCIQRGDTAVWSPEVTASCSTDTEESNSTGMIIGIVVAIAVVMTIAIVVAVVFYRRSKSASTSRKKDEEKGGSEKRFDSVRYEPAAKREEEARGSKSSL